MSLVQSGIFLCLLVLPLAGSRRSDLVNSLFFGFQGGSDFVFSFFDQIGCISEKFVIYGRR